MSIKNHVNHKLITNYNNIRQHLPTYCSFRCFEIIIDT